MKIVTAQKREELFKKWDNTEKVTVSDFQSAVQRAEQCYVECYKSEIRNKKKLYQRKYRLNTDVRERERQYTYELLTGKRNPPCAERTRKFYFAIRNKYGSVQAYNDIKRLEGKVKKEK